jgi:hypothetical protein
METILSLMIGIGLSAACGFRVFVPLLVVSIAAHTGQLTLASSFAWMGSDPALIAFSIATVLEVAAYYVPWLDNLLDSVSSPAAVIAGTVITASLVTDMSPFLKWTLAAIAGGGAAGLVQGTTVLTRGASTATTAGLANPILATAELAGSFFTSILALVAPVLAVLLAVGLVAFVGVRYAKVKRRTSTPAT